MMVIFSKLLGIEMRRKNDTHQNFERRQIVDSGSAAYTGYGSGNKEASDLGKSESGYVAVFANDGTIIEKPLADISSGQSYQYISYTNNIPFNKAFTYMPNHGVSGSITFTPNSTDRIPGAVTLVRLVANGTHSISFNSIKEINTSAGYNNTANILNYLAFFYDGIGYYVNVYQDMSANTVDIVSPELASGSVSNAFRNRINLQFNESLSAGYIPDVTDFTTQPTKTISSVQITGSYLNIYVSSSFEYGDAITLTYSSGSNPLQDSSANKVNNFVNYAITNNIAAPDLIAPTLVSASVSNSVKNTIVLYYNEDLDPLSTTTPSNFTVTASKSVSSVTFVDNKVNVVVNSNYVYGDVITISYDSGSTPIKDLNGNKAANFTNYQVTNSVAFVDSETDVTWGSLQNASDSGSGFILSNNSTPGGGISTTTINANNAFDVIIYYTGTSADTNAIVTYLSTGSSQDFAWSDSLDFIVGLYQYEGSFFLPVGGYAATPLTVTGSGNDVRRIRFRKSNNDILVQQSNDGSTYSNVEVLSNILSGISTIYIKSLFAAPAGTNKIRVRYST